MKGDFSSLAFFGGKTYSRVLAQQGRVQLDADWNTQAELFTRTQRDLACAMFGPQGAPAADPGYAIGVRHGLRFSPGDYVQIGPRDDAGAALCFDAASRFTLELWVLARPGGGGLLSNLNVPQGQAEAGAAHPHPASTARGGCALSIGVDGRLCFEYLHGLALHAEPIITVHSGRALPWDQLCHVCASSDGEHVSLYLDGELVAEQALLKSGAAAPSALLLGARLRNLKPVESLQGTLYMAAIWASAKDPAQVKQLRHRHRHHPQPDLLAAWYFEERDTTLVRDDSGNGHDGQLRHAGHAKGGPVRTGAQLWIGAGKFYLDGFLCENPWPLQLLEQPSLPGSAAPLPEHGKRLVYLDVWERYVSSVEAPDIAEPALGGADTTGRVRTISQVRVGTRAELASRRMHAHGQLRLRPHLAEGACPQDNLLYRVELHHPGALHGSARSIEASVRIVGCERALGLIEMEQCSDEAALWMPGQPLELFEHGGHGESMVVFVQEINPASRTLRVGPVGHHLNGWHLRPLASFKWSRDNGARVYPVHKVEGADLWLEHHSMGQAPLSLNDWVELNDDVLVLNGQPGCLCRIDKLDIDEQGRSRITLALPAGLTALPAAGPRAVLRQWSGTHDTAGAAAALARHAGVQPLEEDLSIEFDGLGEGRCGDYWTFTLRDGLAQLGWPERDGQAEWMAPHGIIHHYAELARLEFHDGGVKVHDLRQVLGALSDYVARAGDTMTGQLNLHAPLHVTGNAVFAHDLKARTLSGQLGHDMVGREQLRDGAVSHKKLAPELGLVPAGFAIVGPSSAAPPGYYYSGMQVRAEHRAAPWTAAPSPRDEAGGARGRCHTATWNDRLFAIFEGSGEVWECGRYDGDGEHWRRLAPMPAPHRHGFAVAVADGGLHAIGGCEADGSHSGRNERFDLELGQWEARAALPHPRSYLAAATLDGRIHVVGGKQQSWSQWLDAGASGRHHVYDPAADSWRAARRFPHASTRLTLCASNGRLHAMGGRRVGPFAFGATRVSRGHYAYHAHGDHWVRMPALVEPMCDGAAVWADGKVYLAGGQGRHGLTNAVYAFSGGEGRWHEQASMLTARAGFGLAHWRSRLYAAGGPSGEAVPAEQCELAHVLHVFYKSQH